MDITDSQVHLWMRNTPDRPWLIGSEQFAHGPEMTGEQMIAKMDAAGVDRAIVVPPSWAGDNNDVAAAAVAANPDRFALAGRIAMTKPLSNEEFATWYRAQNMCAIRLTFARLDAVNWLHDGTADWFWGAAEALDVPVFVFAPNQNDAMAKIAEEHPALRLALCHINLETRLRGDQIAGPITDAIALAEYPNISVKASSLPGYVDEAYPFPTLRPYIRDVVDAFGAERVFWGSDATRLSVPYSEIRRQFTDDLDFLDDRQRELILGGAVSKWVAWPELA